MTRFFGPIYRKDFSLSVRSSFYTHAILRWHHFVKTNQSLTQLVLGVLHRHE